MSLKSSSSSRNLAAPVRFHRTQLRADECYRVKQLRQVRHWRIVYNPMRVFPNNDGSELVFTLYRRPEMSDQEFAEDAKAVEKDLAKLKTLLEE